MNKLRQCKPIDSYLHLKQPNTLLVFAGICLFYATHASGFDFAPPACPSGGVGNRVAYLSEEIPDSCTDASQVQDLIFQLGQTGTLIVDKLCVLDAGIRLPSRFTLKGNGIGNIGALAFDHDGIALSVCPEQPRGYVTISDMDLYGPYRDGDGVSAPNSKGIALANQSIIYLTNIRVSDFHIGLTGSNSYSVFVHGSNISNNVQDNVRIGYASNGWRIRDGLISSAGNWGINVLGPGDERPLSIGINEVWDTSNDLLIDGVRLESNKLGGVRTNAYGTRIVNSRLEFNGHGGIALSHHGVLVDSMAQQTRIQTNLLSGNCIDDLGAGTQMDFNIDAFTC